MKTIEKFEIIFEGKIIATGEKIVFPKVRKTAKLPITVHGLIKINSKRKEP